MATLADGNQLLDLCAVNEWLGDISGDLYTCLTDQPSVYTGIQAYKPLDAYNNLICGL